MINSPYLAPLTPSPCLTAGWVDVLHSVRLQLASRRESVVACALEILQHERRSHGENLTAQIESGGGYLLVREGVLLGVLLVGVRLAAAFEVAHEAVVASIGV